MQGILQPLNILGKLGILEFVVIGTFFFWGGGLCIYFSFLYICTYLLCFCLSFPISIFIFQTFQG